MKNFFVIFMSIAYDINDKSEKNDIFISSETIASKYDWLSVTNWKEAGSLYSGRNLQLHDFYITI